MPTDDKATTHSLVEESEVPVAHRRSLSWDSSVGVAVRGDNSVLRGLAEDKPSPQDAPSEKKNPDQVFSKEPAQDLGRGRHKRQSSVVTGEEVEEDVEEEEESEDEEDEECFLGTSIHVRNLQVFNFPVMSADCGLERYCVLRLGRGRARRKTKPKPPRGSETKWEGEEFKFAPEGRTVRRLIIQVVERYPKKKEKDESSARDLSPTLMPAPSEALSKRKGKGLLLGKMSSSRDYCVGYGVVLLHEIPVNKGRHIELPLITEETTTAMFSLGSDASDEEEAVRALGEMLPPSVRLDLVLLYEPGIKDFKVAKPAPPPLQPVFSGHIGMRTRVIKRWKTRWVALDRRSLRWYDEYLSDVPMTTTEKELLALGTLKLRNAEVYVVPVAKGQVKEDTGVTFAVETPKAKVHLYAPVERAILWIDSIKQLIKQAHHESTDHHHHHHHHPAPSGSVKRQTRMRGLSSGDDSGSDIVAPVEGEGKKWDASSSFTVLSDGEMRESDREQEHTTESHSTSQVAAAVATSDSKDDRHEESEAPQTYGRVYVDEEEPYATETMEAHSKTAILCPECQKWVDHSGVTTAKKAGYLSLKSGRWKKSKKRYCILYGHHMTVYASPKDVAGNAPTDVIHASGADIDGNRYDPSSFTLETRLEEWSMTAETLREGERWFIALEDVTMNVVDVDDEGDEVPRQDGSKTQAEADIASEAASQVTLSSLRHEIVTFMDIVHPIDRTFDRVVDVLRWRHVAHSWAVYTMIVSLLLFPRQAVMFGVATLIMMVLWKRSNPDKHLFPALFIKKKPPVGVIAKAQHTKRKLQKFQNKLRLWNGRADRVKRLFRDFVSQPFERTTWEICAAAAVFYLLSVRYIIVVIITILFARGTFIEDGVRMLIARVKEEGVPLKATVAVLGKNSCDKALANSGLEGNNESSSLASSLNREASEKHQDSEDCDDERVQRDRREFASPPRRRVTSASKISTAAAPLNGHSAGALARLKRFFSRKGKTSAKTKEEEQKEKDKAKTSLAHPSKSTEAVSTHGHAVGTDVANTETAGTTAVMSSDSVQTDGLSASDIAEKVSSDSDSAGDFGSSAPSSPSRPQTVSSAVEADLDKSFEFSGESEEFQPLLQPQHDATLMTGGVDELAGKEREER